MCRGVQKGATTLAQWCGHCETSQAGEGLPQSELASNTVLTLADEVIEGGLTLSGDVYFWPIPDLA